MSQSQFARRKNWVSGNMTASAVDEDLRNLRQQLMKSNNIGTEYNVIDFGAVGDGHTNDANAIQVAYNTLGTAGGGTLVIPAGNYFIGTTSLVFTSPYVKIVGVGNPNTHLNNVAGNSPTTITYSGTGTAITIGASGTQWTQGISMENIGLVVAEGTNSGMDLYGFKDGYIRNVSIFGNSGSSNFGMRVYGCISSVFDMVQISGAGTQVSVANYLGVGIQFLPSSFQVATASDCHRCYFHYCLTGVKVTGSLINFENCDIEACTTGFNQDQNSEIEMSDSKLENNTTQIYFGGASAGGVAYMNMRNCFFNHYSVQILFDGASTVAETICFQDCEFASDNATPYLFTSAMLNSYGLHNISIINPLYAGAGAASFGISSGGSRCVSVSKSVAGAITQPYQASFLVTDGTGAGNVTGDGTLYTELWPTEVYDLSSNFSSNTFTAPVTGKYLLSAQVYLGPILITHTYRTIQIVTTARTYSNVQHCLLAQNVCNLSITVIADMAAGNTATVAVKVESSTKTVGVQNAAANNFFSGSLIN
jgi:hypothetical protein